MYALENIGEKTKFGLEHLKALEDYQSHEKNLLDQNKFFFENLEKKPKIYIFGAFRNGAKFSKYCQNLGLKVAGFIDNDVLKQGTEFHGVPVLPVSAINKDDLVLIASGRHSVEIQKQLNKLGHKHWCNILQFLFWFEAPFHAENNFRNYVKDLFVNKQKYLHLINKFTDEESQRVLNHLIELRLTLNDKHAAFVCDEFDKEYFDPSIIKLGHTESFVDCGAFDGDTVERFMQGAHNQYQHIYYFEPDPKTFQTVQNKFKALPNTTGFNMALFSEDGEQSFANEGDMHSAIHTQGKIKIQTKKMDSLISEPVSFIKMDVEGAEAALLMGAKKIISSNKPKLAMAAYHRSVDLWHLTETVEKILEVPCSFFLRHYSFIFDESCIYAVPTQPYFTA